MLTLNKIAAAAGVVLSVAMTAQAGQNKTDHVAGTVQANGITIAYQMDGPSTGEPLVFIHGLGGEMDEGPDAMTKALGAWGFRVIRFDSRDAGASTHMTAAGAPDMDALLAAISAGQRAPLAYTLLDLGADVAALIKALGYEKAHVVGMSLGGMIGQIVAADFPERVLTFTSLMSTSGNPGVPYGPLIEEVAGGLATALSAELQLEERVTKLVALSRRLDGPDYPQDERMLRKKIRKALIRDATRTPDPHASARQGAAVTAILDRRPWLKRITVPTLIIHGSHDPLAPVAHAHEQAALIPASRLQIIQGMGHSVPDVLWTRVAGLIGQHAARTRTTR
jgi:pimeloyl-ACP methyl ester carboxylesterase